MPLIQWLSSNLRTGAANAGIEARAIEAMYRHFHETFPLVAPGIEYTFENEAYEPASSTWLRVSTRHTVAAIATMGANRLIERKGRLFVQLFGDVDVGREPLAALAAQVRQVLEGRALSLAPGRLHFHEGSSREGPGDARWAMELVTVPFAYR